MDKKRSGSFAELKVATEFSKFGIPVLFPYGDNEPYDLVVELKGEFKTVQVKSTKIINDVLKIEVRKRVGSKRLGSESYKKYNIDFLAVMCVDNESLFLVPFNEINADYNFHLRLSKTKNNQNNGINYADDYYFTNKLKSILKD